MASDSRSNTLGVIPAKAGIQYAAASPYPCTVSGILDSPLAAFAKASEPLDLTPAKPWRSRVAGNDGGARRASAPSSLPDQRQPLVLGQHLDAMLVGFRELRTRTGAGDDEIGFLGHRPRHFCA